MDTTGDDGEGRRWRIGELAAMSGLSVRALRHYDEIGLLSACERTQSGYRLYDPDDVRRLYEIVALRRLGLGLEAIGEALRDGAGATLRDVVRRQRDAITAEISGLQTLRVRLQALCRSLDPVRGRARELIAMFTGGDADIAASMRRLWDNEDPAQVSRGVVDRELSDYSRRVFSAGGGVG